MTSLEYYIEQIKQFISMLTDDIKSGYGTVVTQTKLAVYREVLEHLEEIEQDPCEDAISREDALMCLTGEIKETDTIETIIARFVRKIRKLPPVNPTKTGHWIENAPEYQNIDPPYICSECGNMHLRKTNYCDQCGAKMLEPQERSDKE